MTQTNSKGHQAKTHPKSGRAEAAPQWPVGLRERESGRAKQWVRVRPCSRTSGGPTERRQRGSGRAKRRPRTRVRVQEILDEPRVNHLDGPQRTRVRLSVAGCGSGGATTIRGSGSDSRATQRLLRTTRVRVTAKDRESGRRRGSDASTTRHHYLHGDLYVARQMLET